MPSQSEYNRASQLRELITGGSSGRDRRTASKNASRPAPPSVDKTKVLTPSLSDSCARSASFARDASERPGSNFIASPDLYKWRVSTVAVVGPHVVNLTSLIIYNHPQGASALGASWRINSIFSVGRVSTPSARQVTISVLELSSPILSRRISRYGARIDVGKRVFKLSLFGGRKRSWRDERYTTAVVDEDGRGPRL